MATLDVRAGDGITKIQWGDKDFLEKRTDIHFTIKDCNDNRVNVGFHEVDDLIKALQKAKELWHNKM